MSARMLCFAGSVRTGSFNARLARYAASRAEASGAEATLLDLGEHELPLYNGDIEAAGMPASALRLKDVFLAHDGFLIAAPEYNGSIAPLLKNVIDWVSRPMPDTPPLVWFRGKTAGLLSASPGALGGLRGLMHVRQILAGIGVHVVPDQHAVPRAGAVFDEEGGLADGDHAAAVDRVVARTVETASRLKT